ALALEEATRDAAAGVELLLIVDGQGEEVLALARGLVGDGADQQHGVFNLDDDGAASLAGDLAGFQGDLVLAVLEGLGNFCHVGFLSVLCDPRSAHALPGRSPARDPGSVRPIRRPTPKTTAAHHCAAEGTSISGADRAW